MSGGILERMLVHNAWATRVLLEHCRDLTAGQFTRRFEVGPESLHDTLAHIVGAMMRWANRIDERPDDDTPLTDPRGRTPDELIAFFEEADADLSDVARRVEAEGRLDEMMELTIRGWPEPFRFTRGSAIVHVLTHGVHHRAQCLNMMRRLGLENIPDVDAIDAELSTRAG